MSRYLTLHAGRGAAAPNRVTILGADPLSREKLF